MRHFRWRPRVPAKQAPCPRWAETFGHTFAVGQKTPCKLAKAFTLNGCG